jgi:glycosyltransferase involved in cell wall biosynthesis
VRPLRILHVTPYYEQAWAYGGIPRVVGALTRELAARGHHVTVCTTDACASDRRLPATAGSTRAGWQETSASNVEVRVFRNWSNRLAYDLQLFLPRGFAGYLRNHAGEFDVGHIHACRNVPGVLASRHLARARVPYVVTPNGTAPRIERRQWAKLAFDLAVGNGVLSRAARLLAVTETERRQFEAMGIAADRIGVVGNPVNLDEFAPSISRGAFRRRLGVPAGDELIVFLGKLTPRKRLDVLVRAFAVLNRPHARLVVAGNDMGSGQALDRLVSALGLTDRVLRPGLLTGRTRLEVLADADVVVYPAQDEIFGLVPLEAILCSTPVVVADDSGCGEIVRRTGGGLVVPQGAVRPLADAIATILDASPAWRERAEEAASRVRGWFGAGAVCDQLEAAYCDVLAAR